jgi:hypothetical protein
MERRHFDVGSESGAAYSVDAFGDSFFSLEVPDFSAVELSLFDSFVSVEGFSPDSPLLLLRA